MTGRSPEADVSVVITTYNRAAVLPAALECLLRQQAPGLRYEIVVVDNNSKDATRAVVASFQDRYPQLIRYHFEPRQGIAYGRNAGVLASRAPIIAFTDDDVTISPDWLATLKRSLDEHPEVACVGGRVLPRSNAPLPSWLTREHWGPLALLDYGDTPFYVTAVRRLCLITANIAFRRAMFERIGLFSTRMVLGEDNELLIRLWRSGGQGLYAPELVAACDVPEERLEKAYHRRWHQRHGYFSALMHDEGLENSRYGRFLGVPAWIYRQGAEGAAGWLGCMVRGKTDEAFVHEKRARFSLGFVRARWREVLLPCPSATS
jgi:glycosyltransferase involved in cell wall biosynthesis